MRRFQSVMEAGGMVIVGRRLHQFKQDQVEEELEALQDVADSDDMIPRLRSRVSSKNIRVAKGAELFISVVKE